MYGFSQMENFCLTKKLLQLAVFYIFLTQHSLAQKEETDRVLTKKRGEDAWFLENSVRFFFYFFSYTFHILL